MKTAENGNSVSVHYKGTFPDGEVFDDSRVRGETMNILIGSGKGVVSVESVEKTNWKRKNLKTYRFLSKIYNRTVTKCPLYYS